MARVLVTGMSGAGKWTLLDGLARRGYLAIDTDYDGWMLDNGLWDEPRVTALLDTLLSRVSARASNPYGKRPEEAAEIAHYLLTVEPLLRRGATLELDGRDDRETLVDAVAALLDGGPKEEVPSTRKI
ncbi:ATP-binding protein [Salinibacterium sp.]|uniref:ATP-binding protein n=1 Tax=Salinibacterium sp. TaxID=1915057 RepID=UPI00286C160D|nr:ATP-binding protein [Salinibacterium sp.]